MFFFKISRIKKSKLLGILSIEKGSLPLKNLGVLLSSNKLSVHDYRSLIERIVGWKIQYLPYARILVLIRVVLSIIQIFWFSLFMLSFTMHKEIDSSFRASLWDGVNINMKKAKVAQKDVCVPKEEGGMGLMRSKYWNKTAIMKHVLSVISNENQTLWSDWVVSNILKSKSF